MEGGLLGWIVIAGAAVGAAGFIWRTILRPIVRGAEALGALLTPDDNGRTVIDRMAVIEKRTEQLEPNGGNSLYDRVGKLEVGQAGLQAGQRAMSARITTTNKRLTVVVDGLAPMAKAIGILAGPPRRTATTRKKDQR